MHIAESKDEIKLLQRKKSGLEKIYEFAKWDLDWAPRGASSFEYLNRIGFLSSDLLAVHAVQVTDKDIDLIKKSKTSVAHCPRSNKELGVGKMPLKKFLDAGITVGLGTDSLASVPNLNMWDEMRYAYQIHRRDGVSPEDIFKLATIGGAKALGLGKEIGTLEPGKRADMIAVPLPKKNTGNLYSDLLRETKSCIMTMVNGKILYRE
jgi:cytosine/adenosine deaminase-related metal-dependent hydrolase